MKAIETRYHGPTDTRGSRISAFDSDGNRVSIPYPYELSGEAVHRKAAGGAVPEDGMEREASRWQHQEGLRVCVCGGLRKQVEGRKGQRK